MKNRKTVIAAVICLLVVCGLFLHFSRQNLNDDKVHQTDVAATAEIQTGTGDAEEN